ncbi:MAG: Tfx family DNA-binding protein [Methanothrix sp.]|nr:Tfx family DNA-binding protein [Methanothrix sp.]
MPAKDEAKDLTEETKSFLTDRQMQVLRLRAQGFSQPEVAKMMGTTRANISKLERRAHQNIIAARRTIHDWMKIQAPIITQIPAGTDVLRVPDMIFKEADLMSIHLLANSIDLIVRLKAKAPFLFMRQNLPKDVVIFITREGQILLIDEAVK